MPKKNKNIIQNSVALTTHLLVIGFLSSFLFVLTAVASGISPGDVIALANTSREKAGLTPLSANRALTEAAQAKANDMLKNDYFAHTSPTGVDPWYWIKKEGYQYKAAGENLAINFTSAKEQHSAWMNSSSHRDNILNGRYQEIGVAVVKGKIDGQESIVTVELFGTPLYGAVDHPAAVPPAVQKAPAAIKGVETQALPASVPADTANALPIESQPASEPTVQKNIPVAAVPSGGMAGLEKSFPVFVVLILFSLIAPSAAMLFKAGQSLAIAIRDKHTAIAAALQESQPPILARPHHHMRI
ncbi:MAG: hypothetical protein A2878_00095 [Candidatus Moranbacteria bacterium RIFCSPHIGHO2_01_FULL_54_31]|nr:MAG: hypothetical protein A2878_00095 [Candidatus Moranbacteria bacterium RIFCSPHIGHO2_01_FULL_54_31]